MLVSYQTAMLISAADSAKKYFTVEYPDNRSDNPEASYVRLWLIADFRRAQEHQKRMKLESELYRQRSYVKERNLDNLCYRISKITGLKKDDNAVKQIASNSLDKQDAYDAFQCKRELFDEVEFSKQWKEKNR